MSTGSGIRKPELKLAGNMAENFKNFEMRFDDYCIEREYRDASKDPTTQKNDYYSKKVMEISALRSAMPDEALQIIRYTIEPQMTDADKKKPWIWMKKLREHYTGSIGSSLMTDRFKFWQANQAPSESVQDWEVKIRQSGSLCEYGNATDEMNRDKFVFGLHDTTIRTELLKTHMKADKSKKTMSDVVAEAKTLESAQKTNQLISDSSRSNDEQVNMVESYGSRGNNRGRELRLRRESGTCYFCGRPGPPHPAAECPAKGQICNKCGLNDHFSRVCLEET